MGQALLPEHFYGQEQSLREEVNLRLRMSPAPGWGLGTLQWDGFQLLKGIISIQELTLILPSGTMIDIPGNTAPALLSLKTVGATRASIYVHLQSGFDIVHVEAGDVAEEGIERVVQKIELSSNPTSTTGVQMFKLAEFECGPDGTWSLRPDFLPPSLQVGPSPFFDMYLERMSAILRTFQQLLMAEIQENHLSGDNQATAKQCLHGVYTFQAMLGDLKNEVRHHPYDVFRALRALYIDVCIFGGAQPAELARPYVHEDIAGCWKALLEEMERLLKVGRQEIPYLEFQRKEGLYVCEIDLNIKRARDVYLLIQKPQVSMRLDLGRVKMASASRIHTVHERALSGIPFTPLEKPPFHHGLSSSVEFFTVTPGPEWDYAIRDGKVVLFASPQLEGTRLYLYWRAG
jgi:type VI secretion system protein ImpJ